MRVVLLGYYSVLLSAVVTQPATILEAPPTDSGLDPYENITADNVLEQQDPGSGGGGEGTI